MPMPELSPAFRDLLKRCAMCGGSLPCPLHDAAFMEAILRPPKEEAPRTPWERLECTQTLEGHTGSVYSLTTLPDGTLCSGSGDNTIRIWPRNPDGTYGTSQVLEGHTNGVLSLTTLPDGTLCSGSDDHTIRIWRLPPEVRAQHDTALRAWHERKLGAPEVPPMPE